MADDPVQGISSTDDAPLLSGIPANAGLVFGVPASLPPVTPEEVERIRAEVDALLKPAIDRARTRGKPLMLLVGEDHVSKHTALLETIIYGEARRLADLKDVAIEMPPSIPPDRIPLTNLLMPGTSTTYDQALFFGATTHLVDDLAMQAVQHVENGDQSTGIDGMMVDARNANMAHNLAQISRDTLMITGFVHLDGLSRNPQLRATHEVIAFNVGDLTLFPAMPSKPPIHTLELKGNVAELSPEQLITLGVGADSTRFIEYLNRNGDLATPVEASRALLEADLDFADRPDDAMVNFRRSMALYDLAGETSAPQYTVEAARAYIKFLQSKPPEIIAKLAALAVAANTSQAFHADMVTAVALPPRTTPPVPASSDAPAIRGH